MKYFNYHCHTDYSNTRVSDVVTKRIDYVERAKELGHTAIFSTEHGCSGNILEAYSLAKDNDLKCIFGTELYFTRNIDDKENKGRNWHIIVIALNKKGYRAINRISSFANEHGFYKQPRVDVNLLLTLPAQDVIVTTACINNPIFLSEDGYDAVKDYLIPMRDHFKDHFFIEVQSHNDPDQIKFNKIAVKIAEKLRIPLIAGVDSHYIYPEDGLNRSKWLDGKGFNYEVNEDGFVLDYPSGEELIRRFKAQGVLSEIECLRAIQATHVFDQAEDLGFTKDFKTPVIYPELTLNERLEKLRSLVKNKFKEYLFINKHLTKKQIKHIATEIIKEFRVIEETNDTVYTADYFLFNYQMIKLGVEKYGGVLTKTGRGSASGYFINYLLGFTSVDRFESSIPLYPSRFMSTARLIESHSMPDIDFNVADDKPFIKAQEELLGEYKSVRMVAYGRMKASSAFKNLCRSYGFDPSSYTEMGKFLREAEVDMEKHGDDTKLKEAENDPEWGEVVKESKKYIGVIESISPSPCSFLLSNDDLREQIGIMKIKDELCVAVDKDWAEAYGFLKNDILLVTVWDIISKTYKEIDQPIPTIKELSELLNDDVWRMYELGYTATLNQVATQSSRGQVMLYKPKNIGELSAYTAAVRPAFASLRERFLKREEYTTGVPAIDDILKPSYHYMLYQESIMAILTFLGIEESETYTIIKKISKKKFKEEELIELEKELRKNFIVKIGTDEGFQDIWQVMQDAAQYAFNSSHSVCVAWDSIYGAYLKSHYPIEYYTVCLNIYSDNIDITSVIVSELLYFNISLKQPSFRDSKAAYSYDKSTNTINKGVGSIKNMNYDIADKLYDIRDERFETLGDLFSTMKEIGVNKTKMETLISLDYFKEFGGNAKLLKCYQTYQKYNGKKQFRKDAIPDEFNEEAIKANCGKETEKLYKELDMNKIIQGYFDTIPDESIPPHEQIKLDIELTGSVNTTIDNDKNLHYVTKIRRFNPESTATVEMFNMATGVFGTYKIRSKVFNNTPIKAEQFIYIGKFGEKDKYKRIGNTGIFDLDWETTGEKETTIENYTIARDLK